MKERTVFASTLLIVLVLSLGLVGLSRAQEPGGLEGGPPVAAPSAILVGTSFTYQGRLTDSGSPANGEYDFEFQLYDADSGGGQVGSTVSLEDVTVSNGLFSVDLDFGDVFKGAARWLQVGVRPGASSGAFTTLSPLQALTAAPYALSLRPGADIISSIAGDGVLYARNASAVDESTGFYGHASAASGMTYGVYGESASTSGTGVYGQASAASGYTSGVYGQSASTTGMGVYGKASAASGLTFGVYGKSASTNGMGVYGEADAASGGTYGVRGESFSTAGIGVYGHASAASGYTYGVQGQSDSTEGMGVIGKAVATDGYTYGVWGQSDSTSGKGVFGYASATSGTTYGVYGSTSSPNGYGVYGYATGTSTSYAGYFSGNVHVTGDLSASGVKPFKIDHPLDPANQYLYHYSIESSEVLNQYSGNVTLDVNGEAWVELPEWFPAINTDFRYQLTPIGAPAPNLHIAQEIEGNRFKIAGGEPGMKISWTVMALRNDPYMRQYPQPVEQRKPDDELGTYLYPELYGQPGELGLDYQRHQNMQTPQPQGSE